MDRELDVSYQRRRIGRFFSTKRDGRGLGLTLIREILTAHGARFGLENRAEGGAELRIQF